MPVRGELTRLVWQAHAAALPHRRCLSPLPSCAGACRLSWYIPAAPSFGSSSAVLCTGAGDTCLEPCASGYEKLQAAGICIQKCPDAAAGPAQPCPASRTCVRGTGSLCPVLSDVPYLCTAPESFLGKQACARSAAVSSSRSSCCRCRGSARGWRVQGRLACPAQGALHAAHAKHLLLAVLPQAVARSSRTARLWWTAAKPTSRVTLGWC